MAMINEYAINYDFKIVINSNNIQKPSEMPLWLEGDCSCQDVFVCLYFDNIS